MIEHTPPIAETFAPAMQASTGSFEEDVARAIADDQFVVYYQPVVDARSLRPVGAEALLRWHHPRRGLLRPDAFIADCERTGQIFALDRIAFTEGARQAKRWCRGPRPIDRVSVNVSALHFSADAPLDALLGTLDRLDCAGALIDVELTENVLLRDVDHALEAMGGLRQRGISLTIDDFGVEYAALNYLRRLPAGRLKIDRTFVEDLDNDKTRTIVNFMIKMAHRLNLTVTAEGVETRAQERFLRHNGCNHLQGYRYGAPMPAEDLTAYLATREVKLLTPLVRKRDSAHSSNTKICG